MVSPLIGGFIKKQPGGIHFGAPRNSIQLLQKIHMAAHSSLDEALYVCAEKRYDVDALAL